MKTASLPSLRVDPELRSAAESVLQEGETLSGFIAESLRANIERRRSQREFVARGLASRAQARRTGEYFAAEEVLRGLDDMLGKAKAKVKPKAKARA